MRASMWSDREEFLLWARAVVCGIAISTAIFVVLRSCTR
jgi:hypothetical protein